MSSGSNSKHPRDNCWKYIEFLLFGIKGIRITPGLSLVKLTNLNPVSIPWLIIFSKLSVSKLFDSKIILLLMFSTNGIAIILGIFIPFSKSGFWNLILYGIWLIT